MRIFYMVLFAVVLLSAVSEKTSSTTTAFPFKEIEKSLVLMPTGVVHCCNEPDVSSFTSSFNFKQTVDSFYICRHEVSNGEYLVFLNDIIKDSALYQRMLPDTQVWARLNKVNDPFASYEPFMRYYLRHKAYKDYPLVGVSYEQALKFCEWMTEKYMANPRRKYGKVKFGLPTLAQWVYAAGTKTFPVGDRLQNDKGQWLANFTVFDQGSIRRATVDVRYTGDSFTRQNIFVANHADNLKGVPEQPCTYIMVPVESYWPDTKGIYNQAGNVEEYVREKGYTKGGSWRDPGYYLQNVVEETYDSTNYTSAERGFRYVMEIVK